MQSKKHKKLKGFLKVGTELFRIYGKHKFKCLHCGLNTNISFRYENYKVGPRSCFKCKRMTLLPVIKDD